MEGLEDFAAGAETGHVSQSAEWYDHKKRCLGPSKSAGA